MILDGEVLAWDGEEDKPLAFGSNRTVAEWHRLRRILDGTIDGRDLDLKHHDYNCMVSVQMTFSLEDVRSQVVLVDKGQVEKHP